MTPDIESEIRRLYSAARRGMADGAPATMLHIGVEQTAVASGSGIEPATLIFLTIGTQKTARDFLRHEPPTPHEIENAIMAIEDEVMRARAMISQGSMLLTTDTAIREIARIAQSPDQPELNLTLDAVERLFDRLAAITLGRPVSQDAMPVSAAFAATLLILRECMHHLQFSSLTVIP